MPSANSVASILGDKVAFAHLTRQGLLTAKQGTLTGWLPAIGEHISTCQVIGPCWPDIEWLAANNYETLYLIPDIRYRMIEDAPFIDIHITWRRAEQRFNMVIYRTSERAEEFLALSQRRRALRVTREQNAGSQAFKQE